MSLAVRAALASQPQFASFAVSYWFSRTKSGVVHVLFASSAVLVLLLAPLLVGEPLTRNFTYDFVLIESSIYDKYFGVSRVRFISKP